MRRKIYIGLCFFSFIYTLAYVIQKSFTLTDSGKFLNDYLQFISILPAQLQALRLSLNSLFNDLEDSFQYYTALQEEKMNSFITNNLKDFTNADQSLPVVNSEKICIGTFELT